MRNAWARILERSLASSSKQFRAKICVRLQFVLFPQHHEHRLARIGEYTRLDKAKHPVSKIGWQIDLEAQAAGTRMFPQ
jgi:hypothetical protein